MKHLNIDSYESIGTPMFSKLISMFMISNDNYNWNKSFININVFAPYKWYEMNYLFNQTYSEVKINNSCCLHWFNGSDVSKKFVSLCKLKIHDPSPKHP